MLLNLIDLYCLFQKTGSYIPVQSVHLYWHYIPILRKLDFYQKSNFWSLRKSHYKQTSKKDFLLIHYVLTVYLNLKNNDSIAAVAKVMPDDEEVISENGNENSDDGTTIDNNNSEQ